MFCASVSDGLRSNSGARLTLRTLRLTLALGSDAQGSAVPCASASRPAPDSLAFSRSGARHTPVTDPSNCAGPSPAAIARRARAAPATHGRCSDDNLDSTPISLRRSASRSIAAQRRDLGLRRDRGDALELRRVEIEHGARIGAIGMVGILVEIERQFEARGTRTGPHRIEPRRQRRRERRDQSGDLAERRRA